MWRYKIVIRDINSTDEIEFYKSSNPELKLVDAKIDKSIGEIGSFQFTVPKTHPYINDLVIYQTVVDVYDAYGNDNKIFSGRLISTSENFNGNLSCEAEGYGAYLDDVCISAYVHKVKSVGDLIQGIINQHNAALPSGATDGRLGLGIDESVMQSDFFYFPIEYVTTKQALDDVIEKYGGYYDITPYGDVNYYTTGETAPLCSQEVWFGKNMMEYVQDIDKQEIYSRVYPYGAYIKEFDDDYEQENENILSYHTRVSLASANSGYTLPYVQSDILYNAIGARSTIVINDDIQGYDDVLDPEGGHQAKMLTICGKKLHDMAQAYLQSYQWKTVSIKVTAVDLSLINVDIEPLRVGQRVKIHSKPHNLDITLPLTTVSLDLLNPSNNTYEFGNSFKGSLTKRLRR